MTDVRLTATNPEDSTVVPVSCNAKGELLLEEPIYIEGPTGPKGDKGDPGAPGADGDPFTGTFEGNVTFDGTLRLDHPDDYHAFQTVLNINSQGFLGSMGTNRLSLTGNGYRNLSSQWSSMESGGNYGACILDLKADGNVVLHTSSNFPTGSSPYPPLRVFVSGDGDVGVGTNDPQTRLDVYGEVSLMSRGTSYTIVEQSGLAHLVPVEGVRQSYIDEEGDEHPPVEPAVADRPALRDLPGEVTMLEEQLQKVMERLKMAPQAGWEVWDGEE